MGRRSCGYPARSGWRCRSPSAGSGSWTGWSRGALYNVPVVVELAGRLDVAVLAAALGEVVRRHEVLRTTFQEGAEGPLQIVAETAAFPLPLVDLGALRAGARDAEAGRLAAAATRRPFDLARGPLLRASLLRLEAGRHRAVLTMHHVVSDGWSIGVLMRELGALYAAFAAGSPSPLPELAVQYADFAAWQRRRLSGEHLEAELAWWEGELAGMPAALDLPTDHPRPPQRSGEGAAVGFALDEAELSRLNALSRQQGTTLFMTLLAGFAALLQRYTGADDLAVGTPIAGRTRMETEPLIGLFVNTLVLRTDLSEAFDFAALLAEVRQRTLAAYAHQEVPFERLIERVAPERDLSRPPLVQVLFALQNAPSGPLELPGLALTALPVETGTAKFDLSFTLTEGGPAAGLSGVLEHARELFERATIERLAGHFARLLSAAVEEPRLPLAELPLLSAAEREQLLTGFNDTGATVGSEVSLADLFAAQAARTPERVAVVAGCVRLTYGELNERAERLARRLRALGLGPEILAGVLLERTAELIVALLAVHKAGGAYVPLDPSYPRQRVLQMLEIGRVGLLLTSGRLAAELGDELPARTVLLDAGWEDEGEAEPGVAALPGNLAYVIFTSGSTGVPKGVAIEHRTAAAMVRWSHAMFSADEYAGVLGSTSVCFDMSVFEIFATLSAGGKLLLAENALALPELAAKEEVVLVDTVPSAMAELLRLGSLPASIRTVNLGGEALKGSLVREIYQRLPNVERVVNLYGPSEDTTFSTWSVVPRDGAHPLIGRPLRGESTYVLDAEMRPVPLGIPGALYLGGEGVSRGYLNRPDLTAERYLPNPYGPAGSRLYAVGDLVRYLPSLPTGELDFLGRLDHQVKVRGFRIELGEIESALTRHPEVREAAVLAAPDRVAGGGDRLIAYVDSPADLPVGELRSFLKASLPDYMVPSAFVQLRALPLTPNGKIDRRALAAMSALPPAVEGAAAAKDRAPQSYAEALLVEIWSGIFGHPVGVGDSFFELGGHSLLAMRVVSRVREAFGIELPVRRLFEQPMLAGLAASVEAALGLGGTLEAPPIAKAQRSGPPPLSFAQARLWFLDQLSPGSAVYNMPLPLRLDGALDPSVLRSVLGEVVRRHEALRTTFPSAGGGPYQAIAPEALVPLAIVDLGALPAPGSSAAALAAAEGARPFDLGAGPLLRATLLKLGRERHILLLTMHHIVSDGWSMEVLLRELAALYAAFAAGRPSPLPELPVQYADFAVWQRRWLRGAALERQLGYWRGQLAGAPAGLDLTTDFPRPAVQTFAGATRTAALPAELAADLPGFCRREGVTPFMLLLAGFDILLSRYSGQEDVLVGSPVANRNRSETEGLIGFFVNTLVFRARLGSAPAFRDLLRQVRESALAAYGHQDLPFETLVEELRPERDLSRSPLVQVLFSLQTLGRELPVLDGLELSVPAGELATAKFDLSLFVTDSEAPRPAFRMTAEYNTDLFAAATVDRLLGHLGVLLAAALSEPDRAWRELPLLTAAEREQLLTGFNDTGATLDPETSLAQLFAAQAARTPGRVALVAGSVRLTYGELNERAERLARRLRALGLGPEILAGVLLERTAELIVALLAVHKAGGAYVPLDPSYPRQRVLQMLEIGQVRLLVTSGRLAESLGDELPAQTVLLDAGWEDEGEAESGTQALPGNLAYVIFTSGSTGVPKGVAIEHRTAVAMVRWSHAMFSAAEYAGMLGSTSVCFDMSVFEIFATLSAGGKLLLAENALALPELASRTDGDEVVLVDTVPSAMAELLRLGNLPASIRTVNLGGEALKGSLVREIYQRLPNVERVVNLYGPSEDTTFSTWSVVPRDGAHPLIGRPLTGESTYVLDGEMKPVPLGVPGALYMGGEGVSRGYLNRADLTAERYLPNPYGPAGSRLYAVGDLVRYLPSGELDFLGRLDHQVKVRGFRIELGEIESALTRHPEVREAAVLAAPDKAAGGGDRLIAYVATESELPAGELRAFLKASLPDYMVPSAIVRLGELPLTPNGKFDRRELAAMSALPLQTESAADEAPVSLTPVEELVAGLFSAALQVERVDPRASFFALGGHSLLATQVVSRARQLFGIDLPLRALFEAPTVAGLAAAIAAQGQGGDAAGIPARGRAERTGALPLTFALSFAHERLWLVQQRDPGSAAYNIPVAVELSGALLPSLLAAALAEVASRHESLRTTFVAVAGAPDQRISPPAPAVPLPLVDLAALPAAAGAGEAARLAREQAATGFDLERGPLFAALLVRLAAERHRFLLNLHHAIADGWSIEVLARELGELYAAFRKEGSSPLPELPIQYAEFAVWQRRELAGARSAELAYWETQLAGEIAPVEIPPDRPRPAIQTFRGASRRLVLPAELTARLKRFGREEGVTLFMTLLAATQTLLSRHSGEPDVAVGAPVAGRQWIETEGLIGCFLNTLVLRTDLSASPSFRELAARVRKVTLEAYANQAVPFEAILGRLNVQRDLSRTPLFQVLFNMLNLPAAELSLPGLAMQSLTPAEAPSKFDMTFYVSEAAAEVWINLVYNADLFDEPRMTDLLAQLAALLAQGLERPAEPVAGLSLVTAGARGLLPDPTAFLDASWIGGVHELFAAQAERAPQRTAVVDGGEVWSYGDLLAGSRGVAGWLAAHAVRPGDAVAILAHRSAPVVQAVMGVLTAGAAFMVLDPAYPAPRQVEMLRLGSPRAWIALESAGPVPAAVRDWLEETGCPALELPAGGRAALESLALFASGAPRVTVGPQDVACIGFTSGSTGGPKGILGLHGPLSHFLPAHCRTFELGPDDRFSLLSGLAHDPLQRDIFTPLYLGAAIAIPDPADFGIAGRWAAWMRREGVTVAHLTPALGQLLTELPPGGEREPVPALRRVFLVGEALTLRDVARLRAMAPGVTCVNFYGSTETQRAVAFHRVTEAEVAAVAERARQVLPLGRGMEDVQLLVINGAGGQAGIGEIGEIAVRSPHLARGYIGLAELTAERFLTNPFTGQAGDRIYRTGDLGRYLPDGEVAFAGRSDFQVKLRGFRIEPGEVEATLTSHPAVREAVVLLRADLAGGGGLVAYVVPEGGEEGGVRALRGWLAERLPAYMVPAAFVSLDALPRTPNGKLDRKALERIEPEMEAGSAGWLAPRTPAEELLAGIFAEVLGLARVGVEESFFELGGHSLLATQVTSRIKDVFGVELPLRRLFASPTVAALAAELESAAQASGTLALARVTGSRDLPLSFAQQRLWFLEQLQPGSPVYNLPVGLRLLGGLAVPALRAALSEVVRRHESLRTTFVAADGQPLQRVHSPAAVPLGLIDLSGLDREAREDELSRWVRENAERPFDLARGPLLRASLARLDRAEHALLLAQHHIVSDGWSTGILVREVVALYDVAAAGAPSPLPELAIQYPDFAAWQRGWLVGEALERQVGYWRERLSGLPSLLELPTDRPRPAVRSERGSRYELFLPVETLQGLKALGRRAGVTEFMTLLGLFQALLSRLSGQEQLAVGTVIANRGRSELEPLIGFFANTLVMRGDLSGRPSLRELLLRSRESALEAYAHQDLPFEHLVEALQPVRAMSYTPLFQAMLVLQNTPQKPLAVPGLEAAPLAESRQTGAARFDLTLDLLETPLGLAGSLEYATDLFDRATVARWARHFESLLSSVLAAPADLAQAVLELPLLDAAERQQLAVEWNDTEVVARGTAVHIHELFEEQAARRPEAPAVSGQGETFSYGELEARANRLAHHLRGLGVGPETRVGLCVGRSPEMVVALLGILKTGGAYVPLDPHHPAERLALVLGDSAPAVLVTEERWLERLGAEGVPGPLVVCLDRDRERIAAEPASRLALPSEGGAESLAYVIYTSGSTGRPKGVCLSHGAVVNFLAAMAERLEVGAADVIPALTTLTFDIAGLEIYLPLALGGRVEVIGSEETGDGRQLAARVAASGVTAMQATPATWRLLVDSGWEGLPGLKALCGGEALPRALASELLARGVTLWNLYGPTETAVWSAAGAGGGR